MDFLRKLAKDRMAAFFLCAVLSALMLYLQPVHTAQAAQADTPAIVSAAAEILYNNEGSYNSVNADDNGAVSIGKLQWHGWRALSLLQTIVKADDAQAQKLLGKTLYKEVSSTADTTKWSTRKLNSSEAAAVKKLLATDESKAAQDSLANTDITSYVTQGKRLGITNEPALVYFSDLANQGGSGAAGRVGTAASKIAGSYAAVTLNELHEAAVCDSVMGAYSNRRFATYRYAAGLGWTYCKKGDSFIPYNYTSAVDSGAAWIQRALNSCMKAKLTVTGVYDDATQTAVAAFQSAKKLEVDGCAGKSTILALIKAAASNEKVTPQNPADDPSEPDSPVEPEKPDDPGEDPQKPLNKTVLTAARKSYAYNDTKESFALKVTSSHAQSPITWQSSDKSVAAVSADGIVTVKGAGQARITVKQAQTDQYAAAQLTISITVYSTKPSDYEEPSGALYAGKTMQKQHIQWLQAALVTLDKADITVNGSWSDTMTRLVTEFQQKCGLEADGIAGTATQGMVKRLMAVKTHKPSVTIKSSTDGNKLSWKKYEKANRVYIYRKEKGGSYKRIKTISNMSKKSYQDTKCEKGITYYYVIKYGYIQNKMKVTGVSSGSVSGALC